LELRTVWDWLEKGWKVEWEPQTEEPSYFNLFRTMQLRSYKEEIEKLLRPNVKSWKRTLSRDSSINNSKRTDPSLLLRTSLYL